MTKVLRSPRAVTEDLVKVRLTLLVRLVVSCFESIILDEFILVGDLRNAW